MDARKKNQSDRRVSASFRVGAVALVFLIIGFQTAMFIYRASVVRIVDRHDHPDTVYVADPDVVREMLAEGRSPMQTAPVPRTSSAPRAPSVSRSAGAAESGADAGSPVEIARSTGSHGRADEIRRNHTPRTYDSFPFDPNKVSVDDLMRLGFSQKQAESIDSYRRKGGRFRRKEDFARSFVVADSVYERLEPFIEIPLLDINRADSAAFDALPGIGPFFAARMVSYREELHGYSYPEQLMEIWHFDQEKFDALSDLIAVGECAPYPLWTLPEEELKKHPYIKASAHALVLYRSTMPRSSWTVDELLRNAVISPENAARLSRCRIETP